VLAVPRTDTEIVGDVRDVTFTNVTATAQQGAVLYGSAESTLRNLTLDQVEIQIEDDPNSEVVGGNFDVRWITDTCPPSDPSLPTVYERSIPGLYARHVAGLELDGLGIDRADISSEYFAHGIECERFSGLEIDSYRGRQAPSGSGAATALRDGEVVSVRNSTAAPGAEAFLSLERTTDERVFGNNDVAGAESAIVGKTDAFDATE